MTLRIEDTDTWRASERSFVTVGPPGVLFLGATTLSIVFALDAASRPSLIRLAMAALICIGMAGVWFGRFLIEIVRTRMQMPIRRWVRWLIVPLLLAIVAVTARSGTVFDARLALSRESMDQLAADVTAGRPPRSGWVGLYEVSDLEQTANGFRFVIDDYDFYRIGFAYSPNGEPELTEDNESPLWDFFVSTPVGGGWWLWAEEWD